MDRLSRAGLGVFLAAFVACNGGDRSGPRPESALPSNVTAPFDLGRVIDQVHFAYRPQGTAWTAGHSTYGVRVESGVLEVKPYHHPGAGPAVEGAPVRFGPAVLRRGGQLLGAGEAVARVGEQGELLLARGGVVETLTNSKDGVEQTWRFESSPKGTGALEVRVPVLEGRFLGATRGGLHFEAGKLMVRYGHGTWIDARGRQTAVPARFESGAVVLQVSKQVLEHSAFPAVLDPFVGPELGMGTPVTSPAGNDQSRTAVAWNGASYLVVWQDLRGAAHDIYGARVSGTGVVQDVAGIAITNDLPFQTAPAVAAAGTSFLVVWEDTRNAATSPDLYGSRVSGAGVVQDAAGIAISTATGMQVAPSVASNGTDFLVVWQDRRGGIDDIYGARVTGAGVVQDSTGIAISTATNAQAAPEVAWAGTNYLVAWQDNRGVDDDIYGARVNATGSVQDPSGFAISSASNGQVTPDVACWSSGCLVVWSDLRGTTQDIYGARVNGGVVQEVAGIAISTAAANQTAPAVAYSGSRYLVAWQDQRNGVGGDIYGVRVSLGGTLLDTADMVISAAADMQSAPAVASNGTTVFVLWADLRNGNNDIYGARVGDVGLVMDAAGIVVSTAPSEQTAPAVAWDGTNYLVVWHDYRAGTGSDIYAARVNGAGLVQDPSGIVVSNATGAQDFPAVAWNGTYYLVVWADRRGADSDIYGARVSAGGVVQETAGIAISTAAQDQGAPSVAWGGTSYLVVWEDFRSSSEWEIYGARVAGTGVVQDVAGFHVGGFADNDELPSVAWGGSNFLVVWQNNNSDVFGSRVSTSGTVVESNLLISADLPSETKPRVASNGTDFLVVWEDDRNTYADIYGARVTANGLVLDPAGIGISTAIGHQLSPALTWNGTNYLVIWEDQRSGSSSDVYGTRVSGAGLVGDPAGIAIATSAMNEQYPAIVSRGDARALVAYHRFESAPTVHSRRVFARTVVFEEAPVAIAQGKTTPEDTAVSITLAGTDVESNPLTFAVVTPPTQGTLSGTPPNLVYTPALNYVGGDSFTFKANDGFLDSAPATVSITVTGVNDPPLANALSVSTAEDTDAAVTLTGTDVDGDSLTFTVLTNPIHGTLLGTPPTLVYSPAPNYVGADSFTFRVRDGSVDSASATVSITVTAVNDPPVANAQTVVTAEDTAKSITLTGSDTEGSALTFAIVAGPTHGALTGTAPALTYTPAATYNGPDSFTFKVNDGTVDSAAATISINVTGVNNVPVADAQSLTLAEDTAAAITLTGSDVDGNPLTYTIVAGPANGALSGTPPAGLTYTPAGDYNGPDSFTFKVNDGIVDSAAATVSLTITAVNDAPVGYAQAVTTAEDTAKPITLTGSDTEGSALTFAIVAGPTHGALTGTAPALTYTPAANYAGPDSFTVKANDGALDSAEATITLTLTAVNDAPVFEALADQSVPRSSGTHSMPVNGIGTGGGPDEVSQTVTLTASSSNPAIVPDPTVSGLGSSRTLAFAPADNARGSVTITVTAKDSGGVAGGGVDSSVQTFKIDVTSVNHPPLAQAGSTTSDGLPVALTLQGDDVDGDALTFTVVTQPEHGELSGAAPNLTYSPASGFSGVDSFTFKANDGLADSEPAAFSVTVNGGAAVAQSHYGWSCGCSGAGGAPVGLAALLLAFALRRRPGRRGLTGASAALALFALAAPGVSAAADPSVSAQAPAASEKKPKLAFLGVSAGAGVAAETATSVSGYVQSELISLGAYEVTGSSEIAAMVGLERQKQLLGCSESASNCLAEIAGALDADRAISGDLSRLGDATLLNLSLIDLRTSKPVSRVGRRVSGSGATESLLDEVGPAIYELVSADPALAGRELKFEKAFGGLLIGLRGEADIAGRSIAPAVTSELSGRTLGAAVTVLIGPSPGFRAEGRYYPVELGRVRPYLGIGATLFAPAVGLRGAAGADIRIGQLHLFADAAFERFFNDSAGYNPNAVLLSAGTGWVF